MTDRDLPRSVSRSSLAAILEGRRIAPELNPGRKVRTPQGAMPRNLGLCEPGYTRARTLKGGRDGQCHRKQTASGFRAGGKGEKAG